MITQDSRIRKIIFPKHIVGIYGDVQHAESLLKEKSLQITISEPDCIQLCNNEGEDAAILLDFGREIHGALRCLTFRVYGGQTAQIRITLGESAAEAISRIGQKHATNDHALRDFVWQLPSYSDMTTSESGFRFACIRLLGKNVKIQIKSIVAVSIYSDLEYRGSFRCNDSRLNEIFDTAAYTCHLCVQDYIWDGVKRDRLVWVGDMHPEVLTIRSVFGVIPQVERSLNFIRENTPLPNWMNTYPTYSSWWLIIVRDWYLYSGHYEFVEENRQYIIELTRQLASHINDDGTDSLPRYFLDWPCHGKASEISGSRAVLAMAMEAGADLAQLLNEQRLSELCRQRKRSIQMCPANSHGAKQAAAMLALAGCVDAGIAAEEILANGAQGWSTFMSYYLLKVAAESGMTDTLKALKEYYGGMLDAGATTFWEDFDLEWVRNGGRIDFLPAQGMPDVHGDNGAFCYQGYRHSLCHGWSSAPAAFLLEKVTGIQILEPGCRTIAIEPELGELEWVEATYPTPLGNIRVWHERTSDGEIHSRWEVPNGITVQ